MEAYMLRTGRGSTHHERDAMEAWGESKPRDMAAPPNRV